MKSARQTAFEVLCKIHQSNAYSNLTLDSALSNTELSSRDASLATAIVYGVLERLITLDYVLSSCLDKPIKRLAPEVLTVLRMGAYQLLYMDKIPESAAVNESVALIKKSKSSFASGLVNAVLRRVKREGLKLPKYDNNATEYYSVKYSCPPWLVNMWIDSYGEQNAQGILCTSIGRPPLTVRVNTLKTTKEQLIDTLKEEGVMASSCEFVENALYLENTGSVESLKAYQNGLMHVQDISSQLCCQALGVKQEDTVFDLCAAPGGKTFTLAQYMENKGIIKAFDIYPSRTELIDQGAQRLGIDIVTTCISDASRYRDTLELADAVLCDVPCSGLGIIRRKPEIRYKSLEDIDKLPDLQYLILSNASKYVKIGGTLVYSTCSLNPAENDRVCDRFLLENANYKTIKIFADNPAFQRDSHYVTLFPHKNNSDGFFIAAFYRTE